MCFKNKAKGKGRRGEQIGRGRMGGKGKERRKEERKGGKKKGEKKRKTP